MTTLNFPRPFLSPPPAPFRQPRFAGQYPNCRPELPTQAQPSPGWNLSALLQWLRKALTPQPNPLTPLPPQASFEESVLEPSFRQPVALFLTDGNVGISRFFAHQLKAIMRDPNYRDVRFVTLDPALTPLPEEAPSVVALPALWIFKSGEVTAQITGYREGEQIAEVLDRQLCLG